MLLFDSEIALCDTVANSVAIMWEKYFTRCEPAVILVQLGQGCLVISFADHVTKIQRLQDLPNLLGLGIEGVRLMAHSIIDEISDKHLFAHERQCSMISLIQKVNLCQLYIVYSNMKNVPQKMEVRKVLNEISKCQRCSTHCLKLQNEIYKDQMSITCRDRVIDRLIQDAIAKRSDDSLNRMFFNAVEGRNELYRMLRESQERGVSGLILQQELDEQSKEINSAKKDLQNMKKDQMRLNQQRENEMKAFKEAQQGLKKRIEEIDEQMTILRKSYIIDELLLD